MAHFNDLNLDFIDIEQEGQVQQIIDEQPPSRLLYAEDCSWTQGRKRTDVIIGTSEGTCKIYGKKAMICSSVAAAVSLTPKAIQVQTLLC
tara:strand:+ start:219 stop:488 length:270 start_codon:yes stop_codon:yes gene_type:complete